MATVTIPKKLTKGEDLVVLSRKEYEKLLKTKTVNEFQPTSAEKKALAGARSNRKSGDFLTLNELRQKLGFAD